MGTGELKAFVDSVSSVVEDSLKEFIEDYQDGEGRERLQRFAQAIATDFVSVAREPEENRADLLKTLAGQMLAVGEMNRLRIYNNSETVAQKVLEAVGKLAVAAIPAMLDRIGE